MVVPLLDDGRVILERIFRYSVQRTVLECPSGGLDGEPPEIAARRELEEELGILATDWIDLGTTDPFTANVISPTNMYLARGLSFVDTNPEGTELIESVKCSLEKAVQMVIDSEISHSPSCLTILKSAYLIGSGSS
jgi:ADP-ribose pyrophosphatase